jgi:hypothetical protein
VGARGLHVSRTLFHPPWLTNQSVTACSSTTGCGPNVLYKPSPVAMIFPASSSGTFADGDASNHSSSVPAARTGSTNACSLVVSFESKFVPNALYASVRRVQERGGGDAQR